MKILIDAHVFDGIHQGSRTYIKGLYTELIKQQPSISFYFAGRNTENLQSEFGTHPNVYFLRLRFNKFLRLLWEMPSLIRKHKIDYAHFTYISPPIKNCKIILSMHDILFKDFKDLFPLKYRIVKNFLFEYSARRADALVTISEFSKKRITKHFKIPAQKILVTPIGVTDDFLEEIPEGGAQRIRSKYGIDKYILYVSRIEPRKNHLLLLKAFNDLKLWEQNYRLIFIGKSDLAYHELDEYLANASEQLRASTMHLQNIDAEELISFYQGATLFVFPSLAEGFGIPPIEALSLGTPTLCSNATAMSEFDFLGEDLFDPYNLEELKGRILSKISNPRDPAMLARLRQLVKEKYAWRGSAMKFLSFLEKGRAEE